MIIEGRLYGHYQCPKEHFWISHDASDEPKNVELECVMKMLILSIYDLCITQCPFMILYM